MIEWEKFSSSFHFALVRVQVFTSPIKVQAAINSI